MAPSAEAAIAGAELVYLACPPVPRKAHALAAAGAGKAVFLENPLGIDVAESRDLLQRLEAAGAPTAVNFTQAAGLALADTVEAARSGAMGRLMGVDIVVTYGNWARARPAESWPPKRPTALASIWERSCSSCRQSPQCSRAACSATCLTVRSRACCPAPVARAAA